MAEKINNQNNPFISLNSYKDFNNNLFYSREKQVEDAMTIIQSNSFLAISGDVASGKSSFIDAGLIPRIKKGFNGINGSKVIDCWQMVTSRFNRVPGWIYTKTKSSKKNVKEKYQPSDEALRFYMEKNEIGKREVEELKAFNKEQFYSDLKKLENQIKVYG